MKFDLSAILDWLKNDSHIPVGLVVFATTTVYHFTSGHDLGTNYVNSIYALYVFLGGHALGQMKWGGNTNGNGDSH